MTPVPFDELYRENEGRVRAYITRMIGDAGEAEDLTQETFIRARAGLDRSRSRVQGIKKQIRRMKTPFL